MKGQLNVLIIIVFFKIQDDDLCTNILVNRTAENVYITTFPTLSEVPFYSLLGNLDIYEILFD